MLTFNQVFLFSQLVKSSKNPRIIFFCLSPLREKKGTPDRELVTPKYLIYPSLTDSILDHLCEVHNCVFYWVSLLNTNNNKTEINSNSSAKPVQHYGNEIDHPNASLFNHKY